MSRLQKIDLGKLPVILDNRSILKYNPFFEFPKLIHLGAISERIYGCNYFISDLSDEAYPTYLEKANLRASINDLVSISELYERESTLKIDNTDIPLLHFFKELRITNFHIGTFNSTNIENSVRFLDSDIIVNTSHLIIQNCDIELFQNNNNYKNRYSSDEFHKTINWVNENQKKWGINLIVEEALKQYCYLINNNTV
jgi:hypothetical protein